MASEEPRDGDIVKILISTDNHLGVWEKDDIRRDDSFRSFEEVLMMAKQLDADMVLLGGDLFHENKPSRSTLVRAIQILTKYCLNDKPIQFQLLSDQEQNFASKQANFLDPNLNVGLPVFTIHGNHDDPSGHDNLSAVDILSSCGLVNYFGKQAVAGSSVGRLSLGPVLMKKGHTRLAMYGLGNVRDERLGRVFQTPGCVSWVRPEATVEVGEHDWFNLLVLHQNRVQHGGAQAKGHLQESFLPRFLDLVVWGHEHECKVDAEDIKNPDAAAESDHLARVLQPGSSVATALSEGEAVRKHAFLLEVLGAKYRLSKYALESVRPFIYEIVVLRNQEGVKAEDPDTIAAFLETKVNEMVQRAAQERPAPAGTKPLLPIIRLKVDYTGFSTINAQRFGQRFVGKVANPQDLLHFTKQAARRPKREGEAGGGGPLARHLGEDEEDLLRPEALDQQRIEDLVALNLGQDLQVLTEEDLAAALHQFVEKDDKGAIADVVAKTLRESVKQTLKGVGGPGAGAGAGAATAGDDKELAAMIQQAARERKAAKAAAMTQAENGDAQAAANGAAAAPPAWAQRTGLGHLMSPAGAGPSGAGGLEDDLMDADVGFEDLDALGAPGTAAATQGKAAGGRGKGGAAAGKPPTGSKARGGAAGGRGAKGRQTSVLEAFAKSQGAPASPAGGLSQTSRPRGAAARGRQATAAQLRALEGHGDDDDDEIIEDGHELEDEIEDAAPSGRGARAAPAGRKGAVATASKGGAKAGSQKKRRRSGLSDEDGQEESDEYVAEEEEDDEDDAIDDLDDEEDEAPRGKGRGGRKGSGGGSKAKKPPAKQAKRGTQAQATPAGGGRAAGSRGARSALGTPGISNMGPTPATMPDSIHYINESDDDDDVIEVVPAPPRQAAGTAGGSQQTAPASATTGGARKLPNWGRARK